MRPTSRLFKCPYCERSFWHSLAASPEPETCPLCDNTGTPVEEDPRPLPKGFKGPRISKKRNKSPDMVLRAMEEAEDHRKVILQEQHGFTKEEASLITVSPDAPAAVSPAMTQAMTALGASGMSAASIANDPQIRGSVGQGPYPYAGQRAVEGLRALHASEGNVVTTMPAVEVTVRDQFRRG